jgi:hypothetical protein
VFDCYCVMSFMCGVLDCCVYLFIYIYIYIYIHVVVVCVLFGVVFVVCSYVCLSCVGLMCLC